MLGLHAHALSAMSRGTVLGIVGRACRVGILRIARGRVLRFGLVTVRRSCGRGFLRIRWVCVSVLRRVGGLLHRLLGRNLLLQLLRRLVHRVSGFHGRWLRGCRVKRARLVDGRHIGRLART